MIKGAHVANGEDFLHLHKHHMIQQTPSHTSTFMAIFNHETIIP
jgi:hypothetical protein